MHRLPAITPLLLALGIAACGKSHPSGGDAGSGDAGMDLGFVDIGVEACEDTATGSGAPAILPPPSDCRTDADCISDATICVGAHTPLCGICAPPVDECGNDDECGAGSWCRTTTDRCCSTTSTSCEPSCATTPSICADGERCDTTTGRCERDACLFLDLACPANEDCTPDAASADATGCARRSCTADTDCDCGYCVQGLCESRLGACSSPPP